MKTRLGHKAAKIVGFLFAVVCMMATCISEVKAAGTIAVTPDKTQVSMGETVNVTIVTSAPEDPATVTQVTVTYNPDILTFNDCNVEYGGGGGGLLTFTGDSATITFTATQTGSVAVAAEAIIDDDGANPATAQANLTVGASADANLSSDATLYVLQMSPGEMVPAFSPEVTEYKIIIGNDVTDITVSGAVSDSGAQITAASGFKNLKEGTNQAVITVTAQDGSSLTYHFTIERGEVTQAPEETEEQVDENKEETAQPREGLNVIVDDVNYSIQSMLPQGNLPDGCRKSKATYNGIEVEAALFEKAGLTLVYAIPEGAQEGDFLIYNEGKGELHCFVQIYSIENRYIIPIQAKKNPPAMFQAEKMQWNNTFVPAFVITDSSVKNAGEFFLLYAVNNEGEQGFYLYDTVEGTYQRFLNYTGAKAAVSDGDGVAASKKNVLIIVVIIVLLASAFMLILNILINNKELKEEASLSDEDKKKQPKKKEARKPERKPIGKKKPEKKVTEKQMETADGKKVEKKPAVKRTLIPETVSADENVPKKQVPTTKKQSVQRTVNPSVQSEPKAAMKPAAKPVSKSPVQKPVQSRSEAVPIFTFERPPVQLAREAPLDQLDDDFEFEFINIDNE